MGAAPQSVSARPTNVGKALTLPAGLPVATLLSPKTTPTIPVRGQRVQTEAVPQESSAVDSGFTDGEDDSQSPASAPATLGLPASATPVLPVVTNVATVGVATVPDVPVAVKAAPAIVPDDMPAAVSAVTTVAGKDSSVKAASVAAGTPKSAALPIPVDVIVQQVDMRPRFDDTSEAPSPQPVESAAQPAAPAVSQPEAVVNVVIQTQGAVQATAPEIPPQQGAVPVTAPIVPAAVVTPAASAEPERKKIDVPSSNVPYSEPQQMIVTEQQAKAQPGRVEQRAEIKPEAPAHEFVTPERAQTTPVKSLSLEFTPDGARDVRVRIAERAGEVHVSLHSSDPGVARDLRSGAADLGGALTQAGYDAHAWISERQQQNPQQQPRDEQLRKQGSANTSTENFDGLMTESTENS